MMTFATLGLFQRFKFVNPTPSQRYPSEYIKVAIHHYAVPGWEDTEDMFWFFQQDTSVEVERITS